MKITKMSNLFGPVSLLLTAILISLKFGGMIDWDWFWISSPLWVTFFSLFALVYTTLKSKVYTARN